MTEDELKELEHDSLTDDGLNHRGTLLLIKEVRRLRVMSSEYVCLRCGDPSCYEERTP